MHRQLVLRSTRPARYPKAFRLPIAFRKLATTPPSSSQGQPGTGQIPPAHPEGSNTLIVLSALGALGGLYYYYTRGPSAVDREAARRKEEETERKVRQFGEAGRREVENIAKQGQREYNEAKATVLDATAATRTRATDARAELAQRAQQGAHEAHNKLDDLKNIAERKIGDVRDRSEKKIEGSKGDIARQAREVENKTRGWFGWGSSK